MARVRLFAVAREAAGTANDTIAGDTISDVLQAAVAKYGTHFGEVLSSCKVWLNGEEASGTTRVSDDDEVAVLPPVSGGC
ncbi:MAG: MoaD/ThiS family protein [Ilumatobacteraceae bacterium]|jgi:molybdopterin synthase sulfur carrier subunit|nr:MoaD/ThiS family protein [Ilumatobacteraceae bacterium]